MEEERSMKMSRGIFCLFIYLFVCLFVLFLFLFLFLFFITNDECSSFLSSVISYLTATGSMGLVVRRLCQFVTPMFVFCLLYIDVI